MRAKIRVALASSFIAGTLLVARAAAIVAAGHSGSVAGPQEGANPPSNLKIERSEEAKAVARSVRTRPMHGTVNVFLANRNGLVAVTDSRLSNGTDHEDTGRKLFQIDDHTICSIAGWYSDAGPVIKGDDARSAAYPAYLSVPDIMWAVTSDHTFSSLDIDRKMEVLSEAFAFSLLASANWDVAAGVSRPLSALKVTSEITVAGFDEHGMLKILQADLEPMIKDAQIVQYIAEQKPAVYVTEESGLVSVVRGIPGTAQSILSGSYPGMADDPILGYFKTALASDKGKSLSLTDMRQVAKEIVRRTSQQFPQSVGGRMQIAELSAGRVSEFVQPISGTPQIPRAIFRRVEDSAFRGALAGLIHVTPPQVIFAQKLNLLDGPQSLDNIFFFKSDFARVALTYSGSPRAIFDKSNTVVDSTLTLLPGADPNSNFVRQIKADFPTLKVIDQSGAPRR